jgi:hypothetical protein
MNEFFHFLEDLPLSVFIRESGSIWGFGTVLVLHTMGMSLVAGLSAMINLRLLGIASVVPVKPLEKLYPFMWWGFGLNAVTGTLLILQDAVSKLNNWDFYLKLAFVFTGIFLLKRIRSTVFANPNLDKDPSVISGAKMMAIASLFCWLGAITCGRLLAYVGPVAGLAE